jgi:hypothetical protein
MMPKGYREWARKNIGEDVDVNDDESSLRDAFAMQAMNAIIISNNADISVMGLGAAIDAYNIADKMLEARKK